jgi:hypothetical protein
MKEWNVKIYEAKIIIEKPTILSISKIVAKNKILL